MIPLYTLLLSLATTHLVVAQDDRQKTAGHTFFLSHLSPLFTYEPSAPTDDAEAGWNSSLARHSTTNANASVEFAYFGTSFDITGNYSSLVGGSGRFETNSDWYEASIKTNGSDDSYMNIRSFLIRSNVPADSW
jgi:hypothetical protein